MTTKTNNSFPKVVLIIGLVIFSGAALSSCTEIPEPVPTIMPTETKMSETSGPDLAELFERYTVVGIDRDSFLNVHEIPSADSSVLTQIPPYGTDIQPTGEIHQNGGATWILIDNQGITGWVNLELLAEQYGSIPEELIILGQRVLESLKIRQYNQLLPIIHPEKCLRFSPYQYLNNDNRLVCPPELDSFTSSTETFSWGHYDGTGKPINLNFNEYNQEFIYDHEYLKPTVIGFNIEVSSGNSINNIQEIYPDGIMIEYYFPGIDPRYGGMDWRSLRLVFIPENDQWYLTAIIHGEWTI